MKKNGPTIVPLPYKPIHNVNWGEFGHFLVCLSIQRLIIMIDNLIIETKLIERRIIRFTFDHTIVFCTNKI